MRHVHIQHIDLSTQPMCSSIYRAESLGLRYALQHVYQRARTPQVTSRTAQVKCLGILEK